MQSWRKIDIFPELMESIYKHCNSNINLLKYSSFQHGRYGLCKLLTYIFPRTYGSNLRGITNFQSSSTTGSPVTLFSTSISRAADQIAEIKENRIINIFTVKVIKKIFSICFFNLKTREANPEVPSPTLVVVFTTCKSSFLVIKSPTE